MMDDYVTTQVLPQKAVSAAISKDDSERIHAATMLEEASNGARIAAHDKTIGHMVDTQVGHERRLAAQDHDIRMIERELRSIDQRLSRYGLIVFALVLAVGWTLI